MTETTRTRTSSLSGINDNFEKLLQDYNIPMDCYLLTTMISTHYSKAKFVKFFYPTNDRFSCVQLLSFIALLPFIFMIFFSGIIVFAAQALILYLFVESELSVAVSGTLIIPRILLIAIFSMMLLPDFQKSVKKMAIGIKMPMMRSFKIVTFVLSCVQCFICLIVLVSSILVIKTTDTISDLLQNFTVLYIIIQIDEVMFTFLSISGVLGCLKILGFKQDDIKKFKSFKLSWKFWRKKKDNKEQLEIEEEIKKTVERFLIFGQLFLFIFDAVVTYFVMSTDFSDL